MYPALVESNSTNLLKRTVEPFSHTQQRPLKLVPQPTNFQNILVRKTRQTVFYTLVVVPKNLTAVRNVLLPCNILKIAESIICPYTVLMVDFFGRGARAKKGFRNYTVNQERCVPVIVSNAKDQIPIGTQRTLSAGGYTLMVLRSVADIAFSRSLVAPAKPRNCRPTFSAGF